MGDDRIKRPAYQWYVEAARGDEIFMLMTYEQQGIYRALLDHQWIEGSIPAVPQQIASLVPKVPRKRFLKLWVLISSKFIQNANGRLVNEKLEAQRERLDQFIEEQRKRGQMGGRRRVDNLALAQAGLEGSLKPTLKPESSSLSLSCTKRGESTPAPSLTFTAPIVSQSSHRNHACCGKVCLHSSQFENFVQRVAHMKDPDGYVRSWFVAVDVRYTSGDKRNEIIGQDMFAFWRERWAESHPTTPAAKPGEARRKLPSVDEIRRANEQRPS